MVINNIYKMIYIVLDGLRNGSCCSILGNVIACKQDTGITSYKMGDTGTTVKEKYLGVKISADVEVSEQCGIAASKGNKMFGLIRRNISCKEKKLIIRNSS